MNRKYEIRPLTEEEETFIEEKINVYADSMAPSEPHTEEEQLVFKVEDEDKNVIGGYIGSSTRSEIEYAKATGKDIHYLE